MSTGAEAACRFTDLRLIEPLEEVAQTVDDHLMDDHQDALLAVLASQHLVETAQTQDDIAPAFAARRPEIELADMSELLGQFGELGTDAGTGEAVENAELLLAQSLVDPSLWHRVVAARRREDCQYMVGSLPGTQVGRAQDDLRPLAGRHLGEPLAERFGLPVAERGQWDIDVSPGDGDVGEPVCLCGVAGDVSGALAVPYHPEGLGPLLCIGRSPISVHAIFSVGSLKRDPSASPAPAPATGRPRGRQPVGRRTRKRSS